MSVALDFEDPKAAIGEKVRHGGDTIEIVGVLENYHQMSLKEVVTPLVYRYTPDFASFFAFKIESENSPELQTPQNNSLSIDGNTRFSYSVGSGAGIYVVEFRSKNPSMRFFIVTGNNEVYLNYLSRNEFKNGSIQFEWSVRKFLTYFNVDEFVKTPVFKNDFAYKAVMISSRRYFKTGFY